MRLPEKKSNLCTQASSCRKQGGQVGTARRVVAKELNTLQLLEESEQTRAYSEELIIPIPISIGTDAHVSSSALGLP